MPRFRMLSCSRKMFRLYSHSSDWQKRKPPVTSDMPVADVTELSDEEPAKTKASSSKPPVKAKAKAKPKTSAPKGKAAKSKAKAKSTPKGKKDDAQTDTEESPPKKKPAQKEKAEKKKTEKNETPEPEAEETPKKGNQKMKRPAASGGEKTDAKTSKVLKVYKYKYHKEGKWGIRAGYQSNKMPEQMTVSFSVVIGTSCNSIFCHRLLLEVFEISFP